VVGRSVELAKHELNAVAHLVFFSFPHSDTSFLSLFALRAGGKVKVASDLTMHQLFVFCRLIGTLVKHNAGDSEGEWMCPIVDQSEIAVQEDHIGLERLSAIEIFAVFKPVAAG
jgi:hypothetical protein